MFAFFYRPVSALQTATTTILWFSLFCSPVVDANAYDNTKPFITFYPSGQLGNQLFQVIPAFVLAEQNNATILIPEDSYIKYKEILWRFSTGNPKNIDYFPKQKVEFKEKYLKLPVLEYQPNMKFSGMYPSYKYFHEYEERIQKLLAPSNSIQKYLNKNYGKYLNRNRPTVALHIRTFWPDVKGMYQKNRLGEIKNFYSTFPAPDIQYIQKAMELFPKNSLFIVCSDNINWAEKALKPLGDRFVFIQKENLFIDFYVLASCDHMIMSNSTFSWWAAYLITNKKKVVVTPIPFLFSPTRHPDDTFPPQWIKLKRSQERKYPDFQGSGIFLKNSTS